MLSQTKLNWLKLWIVPAISTHERRKTKLMHANLNPVKMIYGQKCEHLWIDFRRKWINPRDKIFTLPTFDDSTRVTAPPCWHSFTCPLLPLEVYLDNRTHFRKMSQKIMNLCILDFMRSALKPQLSHSSKHDKLIKYLSTIHHPTQTEHIDLSWKLCDNVIINVPIYVTINESMSPAPMTLMKCFIIITLKITLWHSMVKGGIH